MADARIFVYGNIAHTEFINDNVGSVFKGRLFIIFPINRISGGGIQYHAPVAINTNGFGINIRLFQQPLAILHHLEGIILILNVLINA